MLIFGILVLVLGLMLDALGKAMLANYGWQHHKGVDTLDEEAIRRYGEGENIVRGWAALKGRK